MQIVHEEHHMPTFITFFVNSLLCGMENHFFMIEYYLHNAVLLCFTLNFITGFYHSDEHNLTHKE